jgi:hypothetical protein
VTPSETPAILIELGLESAPRVLLHCVNDAEEERVMDWIRSHEAFAELVLRALELAEEARAA